MSEVRENAARVLDAVREAAARAGREVTLVAASKMNDVSRVREAFEAGVVNFGENRVQELEEKAAADAYAGAHLHFIGHLQRNKVKNVVGKAELIQSVDSEELVSLISRRAELMGVIQRILIEVNIGGEEQKSGVMPEKLTELLEAASRAGHIEVMGLMTIPPVTADIRETCRYFDRMTNLFVDMSGKKYDNVCMHFLSMGMSGDFREAIAAGANMVRVGTAIFGQRHYT